MRVPVILAAIVAWAMLGSCAHNEPRLSPDKRRACLAEGGYESRGPFGYAFCQVRYGDGGRHCSTKSDCEGQCILMNEGPPRYPAGTPASGLCEAERSTFGCFAVIMDGKSIGEICKD